MLECFMLAMTLHTSEQQKAQDELDAVIGRDRLPTPADRAHLPYTEALFWEILRKFPTGIGVCIPTLPPILFFCVPELKYVTGPPHMLREDDIYNGYFIPKGTIILTNVGSVHSILSFNGSKV
jgi:hypothetical protein